MLDPLETRSDDQREADLFADFGARLSVVKADLPGFATHLSGFDTDVDSRDALAKLPLLRKSELMAAQEALPPFGGFVASESLAGSRVFMSPGPVFEAQRPVTDPWSGVRALRAAGFREGMLVHNAFSYHLTPGGFILDESARALGCTVFPAGVGNTAMQVEAARRYRPSTYVGTPDYLATLLDHARESGAPFDSISIGLVSGGALLPDLRQRYGEQGVRVMQCYATADVGVIAYESASDGVVHPGLVINEDLIVELCRPGTGEPVSPGERGEVVVTRLDPLGKLPVAPLLRFATGDLSAWLDEPSPCGRTNRRLAGWLGRADQRTKVRGMFVDPAQIQAVRAAHQGVERVRLTVTHDGSRDAMTLQVQAPTGVDKDQWRVFADKVAKTLQDKVGLAATIDIVEALPPDGIVIEDARRSEQGGGA